jgi:hypothetical protein
MVDRRGVTPPLQPVTPGDLGPGDGGTISPAEKDWLDAARAPWRTALLVGLVVAAVIVFRLVYRRFQR